MGDFLFEEQDQDQDVGVDFEFDAAYEFVAPHYYDFEQGETEEEALAAQRWFERAPGYAMSPLIARLTQGSSNVDNVENDPPDMHIVESNHLSSDMDDNRNSAEGEMEIATPSVPLNERRLGSSVKDACHFTSKSTLTKPTASYLAKTQNANLYKGSDLKSMKHSKLRNTREPASKQAIQAEKTAAQDHQAIKRQKLDGGHLHKVFNPKDQPLHHKLPSRIQPSRDIVNHASGSDGPNERNCIISRPQRFIPKLTIPKEPELETSHRARPPRVKSTAEQEEEMLAKIPKFKALRLNKKILEAPALPPPQKTTAQFPVFQEFNLRTMERAMHHAGLASSMSSTDSVTNAEKNRPKEAPLGGLTEPKMPHLETALRARPPKVKSTEETEKEELEKHPKFKARPFNKRIFSSRGELGMLRNPKRQNTIPLEFHFATDERCHQTAAAPVDLFAKLSLNTESNHETVCKKTVPKPFHLVTEERGAEKEKKFRSELSQQEEKELEARIPKAQPLPLSIDFPSIPSKPQRKENTKPEPFQLESLVRHEEEQRRLMEERVRAEREEAELRRFRAKPITSLVPDPVPEVPRLPLTEMQEFNFRVDSRAVEREEFDRKVREKQLLYQRLKEEYEAVRKEEEERAIKEMRKQMVPHARPMPVFNKPFVPERSTKELTEPRSPRFRLPHRQHSNCYSTHSQDSIDMKDADGFGDTFALAFKENVDNLGTIVPGVSALC